MEIERDEIFALAEHYVESTGLSVFLTGRAGTGKTTFLKHITSTTAKRFVVLAPTGVAAINAGGSTIHSFFQLPLCPYLPDVKELVTEYQMPEKYRSFRKDRLKIIRTLELLIIDEISMVRADLLDAVDMTLRRARRCEQPFGGVQLLMIGDARQLSPVVRENERQYVSQVYPSPYFFSSKALGRLPYITVELQKVHRQRDADFLEILNAVREDSITPALLERLNSRVGAVPAVNPDGSEPIRLVTHNRQADEINGARLAALPGDPVVFGAEVEGDFPENSFPADVALSLKKGAQVMFIRNDSGGAYYNGKIGRIESISPQGAVVVGDAEGNSIAVEPVTWDNSQYALDDDTGEIRQNVLGTFKQLPLKTAWAITIHKSQGLTFDNVIIDAGAAFAFGQVYVALSRCRSLEGIVLDTPVRASSIWTDPEVNAFNGAIPTVERVREMLPAEERRYRFDRMREAFSFDGMVRQLAVLGRIWKDHLKSVYPAKGEVVEECLTRMREAENVSTRFRSQLSRIEATPSLGEDFLADRLAKAAAYYRPLLEQTQRDCAQLPELEIDNAEVKKRLREAGEELLTLLDIACQTMALICEKGFSLDGYGRIRTGCLLEEGRHARTRRLRRLVREEGAAGAVNEALSEKLKAWRDARFKADGVPAFSILTLTTLREIASRIPCTKEELLDIKGFGQARYKKYGEEILAMCREVSGQA